MLKPESAFLSPLHAYTDLSFRLLCEKYGADATCVPLVNATAIVRNQTSLEAININEDEKCVGVQLVGTADMGPASQKIIKAYPSISWFNLNCGCPSARTMDSGSGSAMLNNPEKILSIVKELKSELDLPVSVKIRLKKDFQSTLNLCTDLESVGVDFLVIHGRTAAQGYSGACDWNAIGSIKKSLNIPLVGNGDITSLEDGVSKVRAGLCDMFMIGRAAMTNPMCFSNRTPDSPFQLLSQYVSICEEYSGSLELKNIKLKALQFTRGVYCAASLRDSLMKAKTTDELLRLFASPSPM